jgi:hypothetical protein
MIEIAVMGLCVLMGMCLSYLVWAITTQSGNREWPRRRRRYRL